ncbi:MAG: 50S ribosomal protein L10 [Candidatus Moeniiplasma glomeromycotorum]|nr:50S ribosomal protein L10 [Candidatus Moeniiplasma glomeromycotorum]MCE8169593.1 50S ribosomal protein L10 [Candidatus Moeniiplasma glomeromycotorum]
MSSLTIKTTVIQDIQNHLTPSAAWVAWDFSYLDNEQIFNLKKELRDEKVVFKVYKNSLISRVLPAHAPIFQQPTALIFCSPQTLPKTLQILNQFQPPHSPIKRFKVGQEGTKILDSVQLTKWANLPSQEVLFSTLCFSLQWPLRRLISVLEQIKGQEVKS